MENMIIRTDNLVKEYRRYKKREGIRGSIASLWKRDYEEKDLILPYGIMATLPVQSMIGEMNLKLAVYGAGIVVLFSRITAVLWKQGLKHYNSASS